MDRFIDRADSDDSLGSLPSNCACNGEELQEAVLVDNTAMQATATSMESSQNATSISFTVNAKPTNVVNPMAHTFHADKSAVTSEATEEARDLVAVKRTSSHDISSMAADDVVPKRIKADRVPYTPPVSTEVGN